MPSRKNRPSGNAAKNEGSKKKDQAAAASPKVTDAAAVQPSVIPSEVSLDDYVVAVGSKPKGSGAGDGDEGKADESFFDAEDDDQTSVSKKDRGHDAKESKDESDENKDGTEATSFVEDPALWEGPSKYRKRHKMSHAFPQIGLKRPIPPDKPRDPLTGVYCVICRNLINPAPIVQCVDCKFPNPFFCVPCFRCAPETRDHRRTHRYKFIDPLGPPIFNTGNDIDRRGINEHIAVLKILENSDRSTWKENNKAFPSLTFDEAQDWLEQLIKSDVGQHLRENSPLSAIRKLLPEDLVDNLLTNNWTPNELLKAKKEIPKRRTRFSEFTDAAQKMKVTDVLHLAGSANVKGQEKNEKSSNEQWKELTKLVAKQNADADGKQKNNPDLWMKKMDMARACSIRESIIKQHETTEASRNPKIDRPERSGVHRVLVGRKHPLPPPVTLMGKKKLNKQDTQLLKQLIAEERRLEDEFQAAAEIQKSLEKEDEDGESDTGSENENDDDSDDDDDDSSLGEGEDDADEFDFGCGDGSDGKFDNAKFEQLLDKYHSKMGFLETDTWGANIEAEFSAALDGKDASYDRANPYTAPICTRSFAETDKEGTERFSKTPPPPAHANRTIMRTRLTDLRWKKGCRWRVSFNVDVPRWKTPPTEMDLLYATAGRGSEGSGFTSAVGEKVDPTNDAFVLGFKDRVLTAKEEDARPSAGGSGGGKKGKAKERVGPTEYEEAEVTYTRKRDEFEVENMNDAEKILENVDSEAMAGRDDTAAFQLASYNRIVKQRVSEAAFAREHNLLPEFLRVHPTNARNHEFILRRTGTNPQTAKDHYAALLPVHQVSTKQMVDQFAGKLAKVEKEHEKLKELVKGRNPEGSPMEEDDG